MFLGVTGERVVPDSLIIPKASDLAQFLLTQVNPYARLIECFREAPENAESLVIDLDLEVGQEPVHQIRKTERIAVTFRSEDSSYPEVVSLRPDFPSVPHLNPRDAEFPRSLCLFEEPYSQIKIHWTSSRLIHRLRSWLRETARGALHQADQPLEPILLPGSRHLIVPSDLFSMVDDQPEQLVVELVTIPPHETLIARRATDSSGEQASPLKFAAITFRCPPQTHGVVRVLPRNLEILHQLVQASGLDLIRFIRDQFRSLSPEALPRDVRLILVGHFPKMRNSGSRPEVSDIWAFLTLSTIKEIGCAVGAWSADGNSVGALIGGHLDLEKSRSVEIHALNVHFALSRFQAAELNGSEPDETVIVAVGLGALGSQVVPKLIRSGFGRWQFVDEDIVLPHNLARYELSGHAVGYPKALMCRSVFNRILETPVVDDALVVDVLQPAELHERLQSALTKAELIVDLSASVPVARSLARDVDAPARRISAFLSPSGRDLVVLAEDEKRHTRLDWLEMQYYRELASRTELADHLVVNEGSRLRYARSCRDLTARIPEDWVGLHSAITSRAIREVKSKPEAVICFWKSHPDLSVTSFRVEGSTVVEQQLGDWLLCTDSVLLAKLALSRRSRLPRETGGVLVGAHDFQRHIVYVVDFIPSPADSQEWPTLYVRGHEHLADHLSETSARTAGMLQYVGEWHSHPNGCSTQPSRDDKKVFAWLETYMRSDGLPPLMAIVGGIDVSWFLGTLGE